MASKEINSYVLCHISTMAWRNRMATQSLYHSSCPHGQHSIIGHYKALGLLFKRCTLLLPTKDRLKFTYCKLKQASAAPQIPCFMMERCTAAGSLGFANHGIFLQVINEKRINFNDMKSRFMTLTAGWDEQECNRVFTFLCNFTQLPRKIKIVVTGEPGASRDLEVQLRLFCRHVLLDPSRSHKGCRFWLTQILKSWPMVCQARLLFILYGPLLPDDSLGWQEVLNNGLSNAMLWDLAKALLLLHSNLEDKYWTPDTMLAILEELTVLPQVWHMENLARLLSLCGNTLCHNVLANKALNGRLSEMSRLIVYLILVCEKDGYCMNWAVKMVQQVSKVFCTTADKWSFIQSLENMFSEVTMETYEVAMAGNPRDNLESSQSLLSILNCSAHFHTEILHVFLKEE